MTDVLSVIDTAGTAAAVSDVAARVASAIGADVRQVAYGPHHDVTAEVLRELAEPATILAIVAISAGEPERPWEIVRQCTKPVILIPANARRPRHQRLSRLLVPLDGTAESAGAVHETMDLFAAVGTDLVVLHVFDETTTPRFWDQAAHARQSWEQEFMARYCPVPGARLELRSGVPGELVVDVATDEDVDLITLGWSQHLDGQRARTVRRTVADALTPVMLVPLLAPEPEDLRPLQPGGRARSA